MSFADTSVGTDKTEHKGSVRNRLKEVFGAPFPGHPSARVELSYSEEVFPRFAIANLLDFMRSFKIRPT